MNDRENLKVVLLHDWLTGFRGGERVFEVFCEMYPNAKIYSLIHSKGTVGEKIEGHPIKTSFLNKIPGISKHYRKFLPFFPLAAKSISIPDDTDLVISSTHCVIKGVDIPKNAKHFSYFHSPMRYIYDQFDNYFGPGTNPIIRLAAIICRPFLKWWDYNSNDQIDYMAANSAFVKKRIQLNYHRDAAIIHPFVDLEDFKNAEYKKLNKENFYLMVTAFAPNKRVDLAIKAFNKLGLPLKIIGGGQQENELRNLASKNIEFLGNLSRVEVIKYMHKAKGFIFPGVEDFGITPLESLASGTAIIAFKTGGVLETLNNDVAEYFEESTTESLIKAVQKFETRTFDKATLWERANMFSKENFQKNIQTALDSLF